MESRVSGLSFFSAYLKMSFTYSSMSSSNTFLRPENVFVPMNEETAVGIPLTIMY